MVTLAAARASVDCGAAGTKIPDGIERACREIIDGKQQSPLLLDVFQGGAGTALRVGMALGNRRLVAATHDLIASFHAKGQEFDSIPDEEADPVPRPDADDTRTGVHGVGPDAGERRARARRRPARVVRNQRGSDGDWDRPQRARRLRAALHGPPRGRLRPSLVPRVRAARGDSGSVRPLLVVPEEARGHALERLPQSARAGVPSLGPGGARSRCRQTGQAPGPCRAR